MRSMKLALIRTFAIRYACIAPLSAVWCCNDLFFGSMFVIEYI
jgi:hypothetical protein